MGLGIYRALPCPTKLNIIFNYLPLVFGLSRSSFRVHRLRTTKLSFVHVHVTFVRLCRIRSPLIIHHSSFTAHRSSLTAHRLRATKLPFVHFVSFVRLCRIRSSLIIHRSPLTAHHLTLQNYINPVPKTILLTTVDKPFTCY